MDLQRVYDLMNIEQQCVTRASIDWCNRDCEKCDLVQKDSELIKAYSIVKDLIQKEMGGQNEKKS